MKKFLFICLAMSAILIITACANLCKQSIDNGSYTIPKWMPGQWTELKTDGSKGSVTYKIEALKDTAYDKAGDPKDANFQKHPIIMSQIGATIFMSIYDKGNEADAVDPGWYLYKFERISDKEFTLTPLKENTIGYEASQEQIQSYLKANKDKARTYDNAAIERYIKQ